MLRPRGPRRRHAGRALRAEGPGRPDAPASLRNCIQRSHVQPLCRWLGRRRRRRLRLAGGGGLPAAVRRAAQDGARPEMHQRDLSGARAERQRGVPRCCCGRGRRDLARAGQPLKAPPRFRAPISSAGAAIGSQPACPDLHSKPDLRPNDGRALHPGRTARAPCTGTPATPPPPPALGESRQREPGASGIQGLNLLCLGHLRHLCHLHHDRHTPHRRPRGPALRARQRERVRHAPAAGVAGVRP